MVARGGNLNDWAIMACLALSILGAAGWNWAVGYRRKKLLENGLRARLLEKE